MLTRAVSSGLFISFAVFAAPALLLSLVLRLIVFVFILYIFNYLFVTMQTYHWRKKALSGFERFLKVVKDYRRNQQIIIDS